MTDPVSAMLVKRQSVDSGGSGGALFALVGHAVLLLVALSAAPSPAKLLDPDDVMFGVPMPQGSPDGGARCGVDRSTAGVEPQRVQKPPTRPVRATDLVAGLPVKSRPTPDGATGGRVLSGGTGGPVGVAVGSPLGEVGPHSWYLVGVQSKIWSLWAAEVRPAAATAPVIDLVILHDGTLGSVELVQSSGLPLLDMAAKRSVWSAGPFAPLPKDVADGRMRIRAIFRADD